jgi:hypothetical protein
VVAAVALLTNLPPGNRPSAASAATQPAAGGPAVIAANGGARVSVWPGRAGANAIGLVLPRSAGDPKLRLQRQDGSQQPVSLRQVGPGTWLAWTSGLPPGKLIAQVSAGSRTWAATLEIGAAQRSLGVPPAPLATGPVAAGEAADLAVAAQRVGRRLVRFTVLNADGSAARTVALVAGQALATPCLRTVDVCYQASVPAGATSLTVRVLRAGQPAVSATFGLPAADAQPAAALVRSTARALNALRSLRIDNVIASDPVHSVHTLFTERTPDRLVINVIGGEQSRVIGNHRWDLQNGSWVKQSIQPLTLPDAFWAGGAQAAYVSGSTAQTIEVTLAVPNGPTFFRLLVDRRTHLVQRLWMVTAAHFMHERYYDFNRAPAITPP